MRLVSALPPAVVLELLAASAQEGWMSLAHLALALVGLAALLVACRRMSVARAQEPCRTSADVSAASDSGRNRGARRHRRGRHRAHGSPGARLEGKVTQKRTRLILVKTTSEEFLQDGLVVIDSLVIHERDV